MFKLKLFNYYCTLSILLYIFYLFRKKILNQNDSLSYINIRYRFCISLFGIFFFSLKELIWQSIKSDRRRRPFSALLLVANRDREKCAQKRIESRNAAGYLTSAKRDAKASREIRSGAFFFFLAGAELVVASPTRTSSKDGVDVPRTVRAFANVRACVPPLRLVRASGIRGRDVLARANARGRPHSGGRSASEKTAAGIVFRSYRQVYLPGSDSRNTSPVRACHFCGAPDTREYSPKAASLRIFNARVIPRPAMTTTISCRCSPRDACFDRISGSAIATISFA